MPKGIYKHKKLSEETKRKIGKSNLGRIFSKETRKKISGALKGKMEGNNHPMYGKYHTEETKEKMKLSRLKRKERVGYINSLGTRKKISKSLTGRRISEKTRKKMSLANKKEKNCNWKGGVTPLNKLLRMSSKWKIWRELVFLRDNFTCQNPNCKFCQNKIGVLLHPHHIKPVFLFTELIFRVDNGITYCAEFHLKSKLHKNIQYDNHRI